jgi:hypothetical protein
MADGLSCKIVTQLERVLPTTTDAGEAVTQGNFKVCDLGVKSVDGLARSGTHI